VTGLPRKNEELRVAVDQWVIDSYRGLLLQVKAMLAAQLKTEANLQRALPTGQNF
jgi:hypothetical protein